jgi:hypothetical protein
VRTRAERRGDRWILNGEKMWITTGDQAGVIVVWARTEPPPERGRLGRDNARGGGHRGISCFLVDGDAPGLSAGKPEDKMGLRASHTVALSLADVELPAEALLGREGKGFEIAMVALDGGRIGIGAQSCGIGGAALEAARDYALRREQFGAPIAQQPAIQAQLADVATELDAAWLLVLRAAWLKEAIASGTREGRFSREAAMAKVFASEAANRAVRRAVQIYGGRGYMEDEPVARYFRDCRVAQIYEGTSEVQRMVIARDLLHGG